MRLNLPCQPDSIKSSATALPGHGYVNITATSLMTSANPFLLPLPSE